MIAVKDSKSVSFLKLEPFTTTLIRLAELVLMLNNFSFDSEHYQQISGVAMGTKMGPSYANLFVGCVEQNNTQDPFLILLPDTLMTA